VARHAAASPGLVVLIYTSWLAPKSERSRENREIMTVSHSLESGGDPMLDTGVAYERDGPPRATGKPPRATGTSLRKLPRTASGGVPYDNPLDHDAFMWSARPAPQRSGSVWHCGKEGSVHAWEAYRVGVDPIAGYSLRWSSQPFAGAQAAATDPFAGLRRKTTSMSSFSDPRVKQQTALRAVASLRDLDEKRARHRKPRPSTAGAHTLSVPAAVTPGCRRSPPTTAMLGNVLLGAAAERPGRSYEFSRYMDKQVRSADFIARDGR